MIATIQKTISLEEFLQQPETKPPQEYINGVITTKPMPQGEHSRLQIKLSTTINQITESAKIAYAFPELRCICNNSAIVPDVAVFAWDRIPRTEKERIANRFDRLPDWSIEILSPDQSLMKVLDKLLFCSENGTNLGWLINPEDETILVVFSDQKVKIFRDDNILPVLDQVELTLIVNDVFYWLNI
ncbi:MAG: Uma2 family endonuclease [Cyanobacterium sp. T60_A2020_053]|nr:Uma2 family endonuclease [Cyanobacterium sp. T60_A2020_053]